MTIASRPSRSRQAARVRTAIAVALALPWLVWAVVRVLGLDTGTLLVPAIAFTPYVAASAWIPSSSACRSCRRPTRGAIDAAGARSLFPYRVLDTRGRRRAARSSRATR